MGYQRAIRAVHFEMIASSNFAVSYGVYLDTYMATELRFGSSTQ
jgi:hypothetical protein